MKYLVRKLYPYFVNKKGSLVYTSFKVTVEEYVKIVIDYVILFFILSFISMFFILILTAGFYDIVLFLMNLLFSIIVSSLVFIYFYFYPDMARADYIKDLEDNLPFFALYFYSYSGSGMNIIEIFKLLNKKKNFGAINKELSYLILLIDLFGYDIVSALIKVANSTPSEKFKEFLYGLVSVIKSGGSLRDFAKIYAKERLGEYEIQLKAYNEKTNLWITLYAFFFITFPIVLLILAFLFSFASGNPSILSSLTFFFVVILPFSYITYLYMIHIYQPKI
ncbi:MAG: type II secretion system F family protein [Nanopusillaceae archaeon]